MMSRFTMRAGRRRLREMLRLAAWARVAPTAA
jgi:hypothetical protein